MRDSWIVLDTETTGLDIYSPSMRCTCIGFYVPALGRFGWIELSDPDIFNKLAKLQRLLNRYTPVFFNAKFDVPVLERKCGLTVPPFHDVYLMGLVVAPEAREHGLKPMARTELGHDRTMEALEISEWLRVQNKVRKAAGERKLTQGDLPFELRQRYCLADVADTAKLFYKWGPRIARTPTLKAQYIDELGLIRPVLGMERAGMRIDLERLARMETELVVQREDHTHKAHELAGKEFNLASPKELAEVLFNGSPPPRLTPKGKPCVNEEVLMRLGTPLSRQVLAWRETSKALKTYCHEFRTYAVENDAGGHRVHPSFNPNGAITGRFSCSRPNLQNVPRAHKDSLIGEMRSVFVPTPGTFFLLMDYSQIELRVGAMYARDKRMLEILASGGDVHGQTATTIFKVNKGQPDYEQKRQVSKTLNFAMFYGAGPQKLAISIYTMSRIDCSVAQARGYIDAYKQAFPGIPDLFLRVIGEVQRTGGVTSAYGKYYPIDPSRAYMGVNYLIQGTCAAILKGAMRRVARVLKGKRTRLVSCVHDELIFEMVHEEMGLVPQLKAAMEAVPGLSVPILVDVSAALGNWGTKRRWGEGRRRQKQG